MEYEYDIAVSFASKQRSYVEKVVDSARSRGLKVFYDKDESNNFWGVNFLVRQREVYGRRARFVVVFLSKDYLARSIPMDELYAAMVRTTGGKSNCVLPVLIGKATVPPELLSPHVGYLHASNYTPDELASQLFMKVMIEKAGVATRLPREVRMIGRRRRLPRAALVVALLVPVLGLTMFPRQVNPTPRMSPAPTSEKESSTTPPTSSGEVAEPEPTMASSASTTPSPVEEREPDPAASPAGRETARNNGPTITLSQGDHTDDHCGPSSSCAWMYIELTGLVPGEQYQLKPYSTDPDYSNRGHELTAEGTEDDAELFAYDDVGETVYVEMTLPDGTTRESNRVTWTAN